MRKVTSNKSIMLGTKTDKDTYKKLLKIAQAREWTISKLIDKAIKDYIDKEKIDNYI